MPKRYILFLIHKLCIVDSACVMLDFIGGAQTRGETDWKIVLSVGPDAGISRESEAGDAAKW